MEKDYLIYITRAENQKKTGRYPVRCVKITPFLAGMIKKTLKNDMRY